MEDFRVQSKRKFLNHMMIFREYRTKKYELHYQKKKKR